MQDCLGLRKISSLIATYNLPAAKRDFCGGWKHRYRIFTLAYSEFVSQGELCIERSDLSQKNFRLNIQIVRNANSGFMHYTNADLICLNNEVSSPDSWSVSTKMALGAKTPGYLYSEMKKCAQVENGTIVFKSGQNFSRIQPVSSMFTCKYNLLDAVQRLSPQILSPVEFLFVDEFDEPGGLHRLKYKKSAEFEMGNGRHLLHCWQQTGAGQVPAVYWTDSCGRLLFFLSGIEVFVLEEEDDLRIRYRQDKSVFEKSAAMFK